MIARACLVLLLVAPGCGLLRQTERLVEQGTQTAERVEAGAATAAATLGHIEKVAARIEASVARMDTDGDGALSRQELLYWLLGVGGAGAASSAASRRRDAKKRGEIHERINELERTTGVRATALPRMVQIESVGPARGFDPNPR